MNIFFEQETKNHKPLIWTLGLLIFFCNISFAQTTIEGLLKSFPNTQYSIKIGQSALNEYAGVIAGQGKTDDKGLFNVIIDLKTEQPVSLFIGNLFFVLWIKPNTALTIKENLDGQYIFSGATDKENKMLFLSKFMQPFTLTGNIGLDSFEPDKQINYLDSIALKRLQILNTMVRTNNLSKIFIEYYKAEIAGFTFFNKNQYPALLKATNKITDKDIPKDYFNFWDKFILEDDSVASNSYQNSLQDFIEYKALERIGKNKTGTEQAWFEMFRTADTLLQQYPLNLQKQKTAYLLLLLEYFNYNVLCY
jgi:hypothetical protein